MIKKKRNTLNNSNNWTEGDIFNLRKGTYEKPTASMILNRERLKAFL